MRHCIAVQMGLALGGALLLSSCGSYSHRPARSPEPKARAGQTGESGSKGGERNRGGSLDRPAPGLPEVNGPGRADPILARLEGRQIRASELGMEVLRHFPDIAGATLTRLIGSEVARREAERAGIVLPNEFVPARTKDFKSDLAREAAVAFGVGTSATDYVRRRFNRSLEDHLTVLLEEARYTWLMNRVIRLHTIRTDRVELDVIVVRRRELAEEVASKLDQGADFSRLAEAHSVHSSAEKGGRLDPLPHEALHPAAASRALLLRPGERTSILEVPVEGGSVQYEILRLVRHWPRRDRSWEQARAEIEAGLNKKPVSRAEWSAWFLRLEKLYKVKLSGNL